MRSTILIAALAAGALSVPYEKRDVIVNTEVDIVDVVYVTDVVTVTQGAPAAATTSCTETTANVNAQANHYPHGHGHHYPGWGGGGGWGGGWSSSQETDGVVTTTVIANPPPPTPTSTYEPPPSPTTTYVPPQPTTQEAPPPANTGSAPVPTSYEERVVFSHNLHRSNNSAPNLIWSPRLAQIAQDIAESCVYAHNVVEGGGGYGQNIAAGVPPDNITAVITDLFYNGEINWYAGLYGQAQPDMTNFDHWGHYSQIVWFKTRQVGCYTQNCTAQGLADVGDDVAKYFTVCNYEPPGNYANEYGDNVLEPLGHPTAQWNTGL